MSKKVFNNELDLYNSLDERQECVLADITVHWADSIIKGGGDTEAAAERAAYNFVPYVEQRVKVAISSGLAFSLLHTAIDMTREMHR